MRRVRLAAGADARALREPGRRGRWREQAAELVGGELVDDDEALWAEHRERAAGLALTRCLPADAPATDRAPARGRARRPSSAATPAACCYADVILGARPRIFRSRRWSGGWWRPTVAETRELLDACVHCGFCLPSCPTYTLWGDEMDSPRGRIHLMNLVERGEIELDATVAGHFDRCLGCLACVPACPSGVRYDILIQRARARRRERAPRSLRAARRRGGRAGARGRGRGCCARWPGRSRLGVRPFPLAPRVQPWPTCGRDRHGSCPPGARCGCGRRCSRDACSGCSSAA